MECTHITVYTVHYYAPLYYCISYCTVLCLLWLCCAVQCLRTRPGSAQPTYLAFTGKSQIYVLYTFMLEKMGKSCGTTFIYIIGHASVRRHCQPDLCFILFLAWPICLQSQFCALAITPCCWSRHSESERSKRLTATEDSMCRGGIYSNVNLQHKAWASPVPYADKMSRRKWRFV